LITLSDGAAHEHRVGRGRLPQRTLLAISGLRLLSGLALPTFKAVLTVQHDLLETTATDRRILACCASAFCILLVFGRVRSSRQAPAAKSASVRGLRWSLRVIGIGGV
jgi:hypothetical protein